MVNNFHRKSYRLWDNVESYAIARQATDDKTTRHMHFSCWITKAAHTARICNAYCISKGHSGYTSAPHGYAVRTLPVFFL
jgi:hypothetical protein